MNKQIKRGLKSAAVLSMLIFSIESTTVESKCSEVVKQNSVICEQNTLPTAGVASLLENNDLVLAEDSKQTKEIVEEYKEGWLTSNVNVRVSPDLESEILETYAFNTQISFTQFNDEWVKITYKDTYAYMYADYISSTKIEYIEFEAPKTNGFKTFMGYKAITLKTSPQYKLQQDFAETGEYGLRMVNGRYCVALGSYFGVSIGQYFDLVLENGTIIPCIMADMKADKHTDKQNIITTYSGCMSEFVVDTAELDNNIKTSGNASSCKEEWKSPVKYVRVYPTNILV